MINEAVVEQAAVDWLSRAQGEAAAAARLLPDLMFLMSSEDVKEGLQSFVDRRQAKFIGR